MNKNNSDLTKQLEELKIEKETYRNNISKLKKTTSELRKNNHENSEILRSIRNFFMTSTMH